jgi:hypothetical protein
MRNMTLPRAQLVGLVKRIMSADGTEEQIDELVDTLRKNVLDPNVTDLIFHTRPELTAEEVVDRALAYKPIAL